MHILTLSVSHYKLDYAAFAAKGDSLYRGHLPLLEPDLSWNETIGRALEFLQRSWSDWHLGDAPDAIGLRVLFGATAFTRPTIATDEALAQLERLVPQAPLHLPLTLAVAKDLRQQFPSIPLVLLFETSFFVALPWREQSYGVDPALVDADKLRRFGYHGIFHSAAYVALARQLRIKRQVGQPRILSLCLEPLPELVSVDDNRPLVVTTGATPLEGLPGDTSAGEVDPGIILELARAAKLGPEAINRTLARESGMTGLVGHPTTLEQVVKAGDSGSRFALELFERRLLLAAGAGIAALRGLDGIVVSGRYAQSCTSIGSHLVDKLSALPGCRDSPPLLLAFLTPRDRLVADATFATATSLGKQVAQEGQSRKEAQRHQNAV